MRTLLESEADMDLVGEAVDGRQTLAVVRETRPDVVLLDIRMPVRDGLATLTDIATDPELRAVRVIMLTVFEHDDYIFEALRNGASGFLLKDAEPDDLLRAIRTVAAGGSLLSPSVTHRLIQEIASQPVQRTDPHPPLDRLTEREREIVAWVTTGRTNDEIAEALVLSPATVRTHVSRAMTKLQARDRTQLAVVGIRSVLIPPDDASTDTH